MRRISTFLLILSGTLFSVFIFIVALYAIVPDFREFVNTSVAGDGDIPVVNNAGETIDADMPEETAVKETVVKEAVISPIADEETALSPEPVKEPDPEPAAEPERVIVDKQYHEDCGTGEGYWVITYSDGSTEVE